MTHRLPRRAALLLPLAALPGCSLFDDVFALFEAGKLRAPVDRSIPLSQFADGLRRVADRQVIGKVVLVPESRS